MQRNSCQLPEIALDCSGRLLTLFPLLLYISLFKLQFMYTHPKWCVVCSLDTSWNCDGFIAWNRWHNPEYLCSPRSIGLWPPLWDCKYSTSQDWCLAKKTDFIPVLRMAIWDSTGGQALFSFWRTHVDHIVCLWSYVEKSVQLFLRDDNINWNSLPFLWFEAGWWGGACSAWQALQWKSFGWQVLLQHTYISYWLSPAFYV